MSVAVPRIGPTFFSSKDLAREFGIDARIVPKRLKDIPVKGLTMDGQHGYLLRDVVHALFGLSDTGVNRDPDRMIPRDRKSWFESELRKLECEEKEGNLVQASDVETKFGDLMKMIARRLETLPDSIERNVQLPDGAFIEIQNALDAFRAELHDYILSDICIEEM